MALRETSGSKIFVALWGDDVTIEAVSRLDTQVLFPHNGIGQTASSTSFRMT
jgi:hypothetical protein